MLTRMLHASMEALTLWLWYVWQSKGDSSKAYAPVVLMTMSKVLFQ